MTRWRMRILAVVCVIAIAAVWAGISRSEPMYHQYTYQGRLLMGGSPANGPYDFEIHRFNAATGGIEVMGGIMGRFQVTNGLFQVDLSLDPDGQKSWLEFNVKRPSDTAYTRLTPRQPIGAAVYSIGEVPHVKKIKFPAAALGSWNTSRKTFSGILVEANYAGNSICAPGISMPEDWDGNSNIILRVSFWPTENSSGTVKFLARAQGRDVGEVMGSPATTEPMWPTNVGPNKMYCLYQQTFVFPASLFKNSSGSAKALLQLFALWRDGTSASGGTETYDHDVEVIGIEIEYMAVH